MDVKDLITRGHSIGGGVVSPDHQWFVLNIPKNASTYITNVLLANRWQHWNLSLGQFHSVIVPLRDPLERWISGTATYCCSHILSPGYGSDHFCRDYNDLVQRLILDNIFFDDHTVPQSTYVDFIPDNYVKKFLMVSTDIMTYLSDITDLQISHHQHIDDNRKENNPENLTISNLLRSRLDHDIMNHINLRYRREYELIRHLHDFSQH